jgi:DNA-binding XRE family transcriptional regulator
LIDYAFDDTLKVSDDAPVDMITNRIAYWRSTMNEGKGVSKAHLARKVHVSRSFVTKLEKGKAQPGAELMLRVAHYFKQTVEAVFRLDDEAGAKPAFICANMIPNSQFKGFTPALAKSLCNNRATTSARPAGMESAKDKMLVGPTATIKGK